MQTVTFATLFFLAQAPAPQGPGIMSLLPMLLIFGAMYFLLIAPQMKKQKQHRKMVEALKAGDMVITNGGIFGKITQVRDDRVLLKVNDNSHLEILKSAIMEKQAPSEK